MARKRVAVTVLAVVALALPRYSTWAASLTVAAPGRIHAQRLVVVAPSVCWTGTVTFTPDQPFGNPQSYHKVIVTGAPNAFKNCVGQIADVSINKNGTQVDFARGYTIQVKDATSFTVVLAKGILPVPVPAGTTYTLVIHP
jgi:hypothetical protein